MSGSLPQDQNQLNKAMNVYFLVHSPIAICDKDARPESFYIMFITSTHLSYRKL